MQNKDFIPPCKSRNNSSPDPLYKKYERRTVPEKNYDARCTHGSSHRNKGHREW